LDLFVLAKTFIPNQGSTFQKTNLDKNEDGYEQILHNECLSDMIVSIENNQKFLKVDLTRVRRSLKRLLKELHSEDREISLLLVDDEQIKEINKTYLHRDCSTNVISFSMTEGEFSDINPQILGDIVISVETASRDAISANIDLMDEVEFLIIHGLLHLHRFNHENTSVEKAKEMNTREQELFFLLRHYHID
jgi:probable rRNA maturation factor